MKVLSRIVALCLLCTGCAHTAPRSQEIQTRCHAGPLVDAPTKIRVLCRGPSHTLRPVVDELATAKAEEVCPTGYTTESTEFVEHQHIHGTPYWSDSYQAVIVCHSQ